MGRRVGEDKTLEAALEPGRLSKNDLRTLRKQCWKYQTTALTVVVLPQAAGTAQKRAYPQSKNPKLLCLSGDPPELLSSGPS